MSRKTDTSIRKSAYMLTVLSVFMMLVFSACVTTRQTRIVSKDHTLIKAIEIYQIQSQYNEGNISELREENIPIGYVSSDDYEAFLAELSAMTFSKEMILFPIPMDGGYDYTGVVISVVYTDDGYDIIAENGQFFYRIGADGEGKYRYDASNYDGEAAFADFIQKYIPNEKNEKPFSQD